MPTDDAHSYQLFPRHRWVYNKLEIAESQGLEHAPHGWLMPAGYPVFSKPIYNMEGMGAGSRVIESAEELERCHAPGHMWMKLLTGEHVSSDVAVVDGEAVWWRHTLAASVGEGVFDYWTILAEPRPAIETYCGDWLREHLAGYTGIVNLETIGGKIIECHLRMSDQWVDLYGAGWVEALVGLYGEGRWEFADADRRTGYSVVLFGPHGTRYRHPEPALVDELLAHPEVSSIQICFYEDKPPEAHSMPPGGFRLAIVNCWDLDAGIEARRRLALRFWSVQSLKRRRGSPASGTSGPAPGAHR